MELNPGASLRVRCENNKNKMDSTLMDSKLKDKDPIILII